MKGKSLFDLRPAARVFSRRRANREGSPWRSMLAICLLASAWVNAGAATVRGIAEATGVSANSFGNFPNSGAGGFSVSGKDALAQQTTRADFQHIFTTGDPPSPRLGILSQAIASGEIGTLSGYASAEAKGFSVVSANGVSARAAVIAFDRFSVTSGVLPAGTPVDLIFDLDVHGNGSFYADYSVTQISQFNGNAVNGPRKSLNLQMQAFGPSGIGGQRSGVVQALVGERYALEYGLIVLATVGTSGINGETRFSVSDYANTSHYFAQAQTAGVFLTTESGHDYMQPAAVPLPTGVWMLISALGSIVWRSRAKSPYPMMP